jgi:hypothetical protein
MIELRKRGHVTLDRILACPVIYAEALDCEVKEAGDDRHQEGKFHSRLAEAE